MTDIYKESFTNIQTDRQTNKQTLIENPKQIDKIKLKMKATL